MMWFRWARTIFLNVSDARTKNPNDCVIIKICTQTHTALCVRFDTTLMRETTAAREGNEFDKYTPLVCAHRTGNMEIGKLWSVMWGTSL